MLPKRFNLRLMIIYVFEGFGVPAKAACSTTLQGPCGRGFHAQNGTRVPVRLQGAIE